MKRIAAALIVAGIVFTGVGCVSIHPRSITAPPPPCDGTGVCKVDVSVNACLITATPNELRVTKRNGIDIFWDLDPQSGYRFNPIDGIKLKPNQPDESEFGDPQWLAEGKKFKLFDKNSKTTPGQKTYNNYTIKVQLKGLLGNWVDCPPLDPIIINEG